MDTKTQDDRLTSYPPMDIIGRMTQNMADIIRRAFEKSGLNMKQLADKAETPYGLTHRFLTRQDAGLNLQTAAKFCAVLGLELQPKKRRRSRG